MASCRLWLSLPLGGALTLFATGVHQLKEIVCLPGELSFLLLGFFSLCFVLLIVILDLGPSSSLAPPASPDWFHKRKWVVHASSLPCMILYLVTYMSYVTQGLQNSSREYILNWSYLFITMWSLIFTYLGFDFIFKALLKTLSQNTFSQFLP